MPIELQNIIKPVYKISDGGYENKTLVTTTDKCWLASYNEVGFADSKYNLTGQGETYSATFSNNSSRKKAVYGGVETETERWWLRSSYYNGDSMFYRVTNTGGYYNESASYEYYVAFGFCI